MKCFLLVLSVLVNWCFCSQIVYIGLRDLDAGEKAAIKALKVKAFTMHVCDY